MSLLHAGRIAAAYLDTRLCDTTARDRAALLARQRRLWGRLAPALARTPALAALAGRPLDAFPVREPAEMRADLGAWNSLGLDAAQILDAAQAAEEGREANLPDQVQAGFSTGSQGARGVFLTTAAERDRYLGALLGRLVTPKRLLRPIRAALILRANNRLYADIQGAGAAFSFIGLDIAPEAQLEALRAFAPTHLVAPPHILVALARLVEAGGWTPRLDGLFYGAEPLGKREGERLTQVFGLSPAPLYQATEGFLGAPCRFGTLHLNEENLIVERDPVAGSNRFRPIITDLRRRGQPMVRVRLDDLVEPRSPCPCGSPRLAIQPVEGRVTDVWRLGEALVLPREIDAAVEAALPLFASWRADASPTGVRVFVADGVHQEPARAALEALLTARGASRPVTAQVVATVETQPKRRRVRWIP
ncbi:cell division protein FtsA [Caulobacter sp. BE254]|uniref:cell division protein FtsA n=1 Tax=Caulobacter sp. BE254 TaxID=2817720 RepID=UPI00285E4855|nr:cell division protein FtsA [Caulobacter sp. BE254]MDR7114158.1 putative adenylate-forming enzyme [Caulobacter sp. BE254]